MRRFRAILFALVAFLWLPISVHCQLETVPGLEFLRCTSQSSDSHSPANDCNNCCAVEKSQYRTEDVRLASPTAQLQPLRFEPVAGVVAAPPAEVSSRALTAAPPESFHIRHFLSRTALPARAPSIAS